MKILIKEQQLDRLVSKYLDSKNWKMWDEGNGDFNLTDGENGKDIFKFRTQYSSFEPNHSFGVLYIHDDIDNVIIKLFSIPSYQSSILIVNWFNKKYDKNLTVEDLEWFGFERDYDAYEDMNENIIKEEYDGNRLYPKDEILRLLKGAPKEIRQAARKLPNVECENDKGQRTICTKIPQTIYVYLTGRY
jgi:hypothetical protein